MSIKIKRTDLELVEGYPKADARNREIYLFRQRNTETKEIIGYIVSVPDKFYVKNFNTKKAAIEYVEKELLPDTHIFNGSTDMDIEETASIYEGHISEIYLQQQSQAKEQQTQQQVQQQTQQTNQQKV